MCTLVLTTARCRCSIHTHLAGCSVPREHIMSTRGATSSAFFFPPSFVFCSMGFPSRIDFVRACQGSDRVRVYLSGSRPFAFSVPGVRHRSASIRCCRVVYAAPSRSSSSYALYRGRKNRNKKARQSPTKSSSPWPYGSIGPSELPWARPGALWIAVISRTHARSYPPVL